MPDTPDLPDAWHERASALAGTERVDTDTIDYLARQALAADWTVRRQGRHYFRATKTVGDHIEQVSVSCTAGKLSSSRVQVLDATSTSDQVVAWLRDEN